MGGIGGFFKNPTSTLFGSGYNPTRDISKQYLQQRGNLSGAFENRLAGSTAGVQRFDPMYQAAIRSRVNYLQQQPFSSEEDALSLGRAATSTAAQYGSARSNLARMLANRGLGGGIEAGALANLESARMGQLAQAQNQIALNRIAARNAAQQEALGLLGGARSMYANEQMGALGGLSDLYGTQASAYGGLASIEDADRQRRQAQMGQLIQMAANAASPGAGMAMGGGAGMGQTRSVPASDFADAVVVYDSSGNPMLVDRNTGAPLASQMPAQTRRRNFLQKILGI